MTTRLDAIKQRLAAATEAIPEHGCHNFEDECPADEAHMRVYHAKVELERHVPDDLAHLLDLVETLKAALEFYADEKKYFMRKTVTNLQETTAVFHVDNPNELPTAFEANVYECTARLKVDHGKTAREALAKIGGME